MEAVAVAVGIVLVVSVLADLINTLVTTHTHRGRFWLTTQLYGRSWRIVRTLVTRIRNPWRRERAMATFAPVSVLMLLTAWVIQQVVGFGLIWWGLGGISGSDGLGDALYYSGVVYFTLGFGEVVPVDAVPRLGALIEAFSGVLTTALVIGYLPALYGAYSERERKLMTLDDGTEQRITPTSLVISRAPGADPEPLLAYFKEWEDWITGVIETHTAFPMLVLFRSKHAGQNWVTALDLVADAALHCQMIDGIQNREPYWCLRRAIRLFEELTDHIDLSRYMEQQEELHTQALEPESQFRKLYGEMEAHGFDLLSLENAFATTQELRIAYAARLEWLIDELAAPRGFWGHEVGHRVGVIPSLTSDDA